MHTLLRLTHVFLVLLLLSIARASDLSDRFLDRARTKDYESGRMSRPEKHAYLFESNLSKKKAELIEWAGRYGIEVLFRGPKDYGARDRMKLARYRRGQLTKDKDRREFEKTLTDEVRDVEDKLRAAINIPQPKPNKAQAARAQRLFEAFHPQKNVHGIDDAAEVRALKRGIEQRWQKRQQQWRKKAMWEGEANARLDSIERERKNANAQHLENERDKLMRENQHRRDWGFRVNEQDHKQEHFSENANTRRQLDQLRREIDGAGNSQHDRDRIDEMLRNKEMGL